MPNDLDDPAILIGLRRAVRFARPLGTTPRPTETDRTGQKSCAAEQAALGVSAQPYCLIIGGGQGGIMLGARLKQLGVPTIIAEKNEKPGDSWRNRYRSLVLHDPVWYDHLPYLPFPDNWPVFTPKDKMGDWLEVVREAHGAQLLGLHRGQERSLRRTRKRWTVDLIRQGRSITIEPTQLVFATGAYGPPNWIELPGADVFRGELLHSSSYSDGRALRGQELRRDRRCELGT